MSNLDLKSLYPESHFIREINPLAFGLEYTGVKLEVTGFRGITNPFSLWVRSNDLNSMSEYTNFLINKYRGGNEAFIHLRGTNGTIQKFVVEYKYMGSDQDEKGYYSKGTVVLHHVPPKRNMFGFEY